MGVRTLCTRHCLLFFICFVFDFGKPSFDFSYKPKMTCNTTSEPTWRLWWSLNIPLEVIYCWIQNHMLHNIYNIWISACLSTALFFPACSKMVTPENEAFCALQFAKSDFFSCGIFAILRNLFVKRVLNFICQRRQCPRFKEHVYTIP